MGEHTIREVLKRRSDDTQRVIRRRREHATQKSGTHRGSRRVLFITVIIILVILAVVAYSGWLISQVNERFSADRGANAAGSNGLSLSLQATTQFLPNTLLAATDPNFYNNSNINVSPLTARLVRMYFPNASIPATNLMVVALQYRYSRTDILETYINDVNLGKNAGQPIRGFASASQVYFKKPFAQLQPQDVALLVALAAYPDDFDPRLNAGQALTLRNAVLQEDAQQGVLSQAQVDAFKKSPLDLAL
ncbi:MAG: transglycosylase domain-containing protein [Gammaproteobacteria bacterium]